MERKNLKNCPKASYTVGINLRLDIETSCELRKIKKKHNLTLQTQINAILKKALDVKLNEIEENALLLIEETLNSDV